MAVQDSKRVDSLAIPDQRGGSAAGRRQGGLTPGFGGEGSRPGSRGSNKNSNPSLRVSCTEALSKVKRALAFAFGRVIRRQYPTYQQDLAHSQQEPITAHSKYLSELLGRFQITPKTRQRNASVINLTERNERSERLRTHYRYNSYSVFEDTLKATDVQLKHTLFELVPEEKEKWAGIVIRKPVSSLDRISTQNTRNIFDDSASDVRGDRSVLLLLTSLGSHRPWMVIVSRIWYKISWIEIKKSRTWPNLKIFGMHNQRTCCERWMWTILGSP